MDEIKQMQKTNQEKESLLVSIQNQNDVLNDKLMKLEVDKIDDMNREKRRQQKSY